MTLLEKIRRKRAKRLLKKALKVISKLSWEELDEMFPRPDYMYAFDFKGVDWSNVKFAYSYLGEREDS